jgi:hypothetical protein
MFGRIGRGQTFIFLFFIFSGIGASVMIVPCRAQASQNSSEKIQRLILKDGSYESISQYEVKDTRVRYYSMERHAWEELPEPLIDWPATNRYAEQSARDAADRRKQLLDYAARERNEEEARMPLIAHGVRLPSPNGVFLFDVFQEKPDLVPLIQNSADVNKNMKANILRGIINPVAGSKHTAELKGPHARVQAHVQTPEIYFFIDPGDDAAGYTAKTASEHLRIVRCENKNENRVVLAVNIAIYGKVTQNAQYVETRVEPVTEYWVKIAPSGPLSPGEYALAEWDAKGAMNQYVWDFGVNPLAPPNAATRSEKPEKSEPVLIEKNQK